MNEIKTKTLFEQIPLDMETSETFQIDALSKSRVNTECIAKLYIAFPNGGTYKGTGFLYGNNVLATAGHCIYDPRYGGKATSIRAVFPNGKQYTTSKSGLHAPKKWLEATKNTMGNLWKYDYGVIELSGTPGRTLGYLDYQIISNSKLKAYYDNGTAVVVAGYPAGRTTLRSDSGPIKAYRSDDISFDAYFTHGQSGGPVIVKTTGYFIGIANYGESSTQTYPSGARVNNTVADFLDLYY